jgi:hypothetical protein
MSRVPITVMGYRCEKCSNEWIPLDPKAEPTFCPSCNCTSWDKSAGPMLTYEDFCKKITLTLKERAPLTWTEIRTKAGLPQKFPNNSWVHRMEQDIGLRRSKDSHGIINWQLEETEKNAAAA